MKKFKIGIQLYSVRDEMEKDMEGTIKKIADMGYDCVEFAGYFGHTAEEVRKMCEKCGITPISVHQRNDAFIDDPKGSVDFLKELGVKYCAIPWVDPKRWEEEYDAVVSEIRKTGELFKDSGIKLMYHNHDFELTIKHNGKFVLDSLYEEIPSDLLLPQLDMCWVNYAGQDPIEYIKKYGDVEEVLHVKDFECKNLAAGPVYALIDSKGNDGKRPDREATGFEFRPVGYGRQDFKAILKAAEDTKIKYVIVEQDAHPTNTSLEDAKLSIDYLRSIGY